MEVLTLTKCSAIYLFFLPRVVLLLEESQFPTFQTTKVFKKTKTPRQFVFPSFAVRKKNHVKRYDLNARLKGMLKYFIQVHMTIQSLFFGNFWHICVQLCSSAVTPTFRRDVPDLSFFMLC